MNLKELFKNKLRGTVTIRMGQASRIIIQKKRNSIQGQAKEITAKRLIQHPTSVIDKINFFQGGTLLYSAPITATSILEPQKVQFDANIEPEAFEGTFDRVELTASGLGAFSQLTDLNITKTDTDPLLINWTMKVL